MFRTCVTCPLSPGFQEPPSPQPSPPAEPGEREAYWGASMFRTCVTCPLSPGSAGGEGWGEGGSSSIKKTPQKRGFFISMT